MKIRKGRMGEGNEKKRMEGENKTRKERRKIEGKIGVKKDRKGGKERKVEKRKGIEEGK